MIKKISIIISILFLIIIAIVIYWNVNYIDNVVKTGEAYNFTIGSKKNTAFDTIVKNAKNEKYHSIQVGGNKDFKIIPISELDFDKIKDHNKWRILIENNNFLNTIRLEFRNDSLTLIHRHKQLFELP
jgi:hypothetical protein